MVRQLLCVHVSVSVCVCMHTCGCVCVPALPCITSPSPTVKTTVLCLSTTAPDSRHPLMDTLTRDRGVGLVDIPPPARTTYSVHSISQSVKQLISCEYHMTGSPSSLVVGYQGHRPNHQRLGLDLHWALHC